MSLTIEKGATLEVADAIGRKLIAEGEATFIHEAKVEAPCPQITHEKIEDAAAKWLPPAPLRIGRLKAAVVVSARKLLAALGIGMRVRAVDGARVLVLAKSGALAADAESDRFFEQISKRAWGIK
jgi:transketolase C-terminal domain/subunit